MHNPRSSAKRQTRLAFTPLPSSSPHISPEVQPKAARVRYEDSDTPSKRRRLQNNLTLDAFTETASFTQTAGSSGAGQALERSGEKQKNTGLPTPVQSSQAPWKDAISEDEFISAGDDLSDESSGSDLDRNAVIYATTPLRSNDDGAKVNSTAFFRPSQSSPVLPIQESTRTPTVKKRAKPMNSIFGAFGESTGERHPGLSQESNGKEPAENGISEDEIELPSRRLRTRKRTTIVVSSDESDRGTGDTAASTPRSNGRSSSSKRRASHRKTASSRAGKKHTASEEAPTSSSRKTRSQTAVEKAQDNPRKSSWLDQGRLAPVAVSSDVETEDSGVDFLPTKPVVKARIHQPSEVFENEDNDSESDEVLSPTTKRRPRQVIEAVEDNNEDDDSDKIVSPTTKRRPRQVVEVSEDEAPVKSRKHESEDLVEDLEFLRSADVSATRRNKSDKKEEMRRNLEIMKARRQRKSMGNGIPSTEMNNSSDPTLPEMDDDSVTAAEDAEEEVEEESNLEEPFDAAGEDFDEYEPDFLDDEGAEALEGADMAEMPLEFTMHAHQGVKHHFGHVVEWMVQNKLNPAFARNDPVYRLAFNKVDDEVNGYASSKFISSTWRPDFLRALKARPIFNEMPVRGVYSILPNSCAACGRSNHPASFVVTLTGKAYDKETLENIKEEDDDDDENDDDDADDESVDINGYPLTPEDHEFLVGKVCKANSERAHSLLHWRYHLNSWILDWLEQRGYTSPEQLVRRESWSLGRRNRYAEKVVDEMKQGETKRLWRDFKLQLEGARAQQTYFR